MVPSLERQLARIVRRARRWYARAYLCAGDPRSAVLWSDQTEITVRLALRGDQLWILAGSGLLIRIVADSEGEIVPENVEPVLRAILAGQAVEYFGIAGSEQGRDVPTGYDLGDEVGFAGGLSAAESRYQARIAGPLDDTGFEFPEDDEDD